jgi:hypothetical protein
MTAEALIVALLAGLDVEAHLRPAGLTTADVAAMRRRFVADPDEGGGPRRGGWRDGAPGTAGIDGVRELPRRSRGDVFTARLAR